MGVLEVHQERVAALRQCLTRLLELHRRLHDLHAESLVLAQTGPADRAVQARTLHEQARALHGEIAQLRSHLESGGAHAEE
jgi:hypothetical protein